MNLHTCFKKVPDCRVSRVKSANKTCKVVMISYKSGLPWVLDLPITLPTRRDADNWFKP